MSVDSFQHKCLPRCVASRFDNLGVWRSSPISRRFRQTYNQQKTAYLAKYNAIDSQLNADENSDPLAAAFGGLGSSLEAMGDVVVIFDRLDQVAPSDIEPDVKAIYNSLVNEENDMSNAASNPLGALAGGLVTGLMTSGSWQRVGDYVTANCT